MGKYRFGEYISFLRDNITNLVEYKQMTGTFDPDLWQVEKDLFNEDPFVVFGATLDATLAFSDKRIYH